MKWPQLVPDWACKVPIHIVIEQEGLTEDGGPMQELVDDLMCNWEDTAKTVLTAEQKYVRISGTAFFNGDIAPELPVISGGHAIIFGQKRDIMEGIKARNPDGTVNYTEVRFR